MSNEVRTFECDVDFEITGIVLEENNEEKFGINVKDKFYEGDFVKLDGNKLIHCDEKEALGRLVTDMWSVGTLRYPLRTTQIPPQRIAFLARVLLIGKNSKTIILPTHKGDSKIIDNKEYIKISNSGECLVRDLNGNSD